MASVGYETDLAEDGAQALEHARREIPHIVLSDVLMPVMDGYQLCREWRADPDLAQVPLVFYTANYTSPEDEAFAYSLGADRFLLKPMDPIDILREVDVLLALRGDESYSVRAPAEETETDVLREYNARLVSKMELQVLELTKANASLQEMVKGTVGAIAKLAEARDPYTAGHQERVADIAFHTAAAMKYDEDFCEGIRIAGMVHDIGKISVPAEILTKPAALSDLEYAIVKTHSAVGFDVLSGVTFAWPIAQYVLQHHERMDGSGYPSGLFGDSILPGARILAVADVVEAMSSHRPYKPAAGLETALAEIEQNAGLLYDQDCVTACLSIFRDEGYEPPAASNGQGGRGAG
jgi:response regulator RpfG family c-di-GMP phosphodiesterase